MSKSGVKRCIQTIETILKNIFVFDLFFLLLGAHMPTHYVFGPNPSDELDVIALTKGAIH
jgi:hypothetical protein